MVLHGIMLNWLVPIKVQEARCCGRLFAHFQHFDFFGFPIDFLRQTVIFEAVVVIVQEREIFTNDGVVPIVPLLFFQV